MSDEIFVILQPIFNEIRNICQELFRRLSVLGRVFPSDEVTTKMMDAHVARLENLVTVYYGACLDRLDQITNSKIAGILERLVAVEKTVNSGSIPLTDLGNALQNIARRQNDLELKLNTLAKSVHRNHNDVLRDLRDALSYTLDED